MPASQLLKAASPAIINPWWLVSRRVGQSKCLPWPEKTRFRSNGSSKRDKAGTKGAKSFSITEAFKEPSYLIFSVIWGNSGRLSYFKVRLSIFKAVFESSTPKSLISKRLLLAVTFMANFCNEKPHCSSKLTRRMAAFNESLRNAFSESVAARFFTDRWWALNFPGVSGSDNISYVTLPRLISTELIRKSKLDFVLTVSLDAKASNTNWKLGADSGVSRFKLTVNPKSWTLLMVTLPFNKGRRSNFADKRATFSISWFFRSCKRTSSTMIRFSKPISIRPTETSVFSMFFNSLVTKTDNLPWTYGMFSSTIIPR